MRGRLMASCARVGWQVVRHGVLSLMPGFPAREVRVLKQTELVNRPCRGEEVMMYGIRR